MEWQQSKIHYRVPHPLERESVEQDKIKQKQCDRICGNDRRPWREKFSRQPTKPVKFLDKNIYAYYHFVLIET